MGSMSVLVVTMLTLVAAVFTVLTNFLIYSVFYLILTFFGTTFVLLFWGFEFLGLILLLIYVGAVAVLFVFVVMMLPTPIENELPKLNFRFNKRELLFNSKNL